MTCTVDVVTELLKTCPHTENIGAKLRFVYMTVNSARLQSAIVHLAGDSNLIVYSLSLYISIMPLEQNCY